MEVASKSGTRHSRTRWLIESPQTYVREYRLSQIPVWYEVQDTALSDETADPIAVQDILGSVYIYLSGIALGGTILMLEIICNAVVSVSRRSDVKFGFDS